MIKQSERSALGYRNKTNDVGVDDGEVRLERRRYLELFERVPRTAAFAWAGVVAASAGLAGFLLLWSQNEAAPVSATDGRAGTPSTLASAPEAATQPASVQELRQRGLELLRADFPDDAPSPPSARGDRLEMNDPAIPAGILVATASEVDRVTAPAPSPVPIAPSPRAEAKLHNPEKIKEVRAVERPVHRRHERRVLTHRRDRVRMANANYVQARREPLTTTVPQEETSAFGSLAPWSSWKNDWDKLWSKGTDGK